jgi:hypothetical protein
MSDPADKRDNMHKTRTAAATVIGAGIAIVVPLSAATASRPAVSGTVHVTEIYDFQGPGVATEGVTNLVGHDIVTGVIGDNGRATTPTAGSTTETLHLRKGTVTADAKNFLTGAAPKYPGGASSCSEAGTYTSGKVKFVRGTGAYAGIRGTLTYVGSYAVTGVITNGTCSFDKATSVIEVFRGTGKVAF